METNEIKKLLYKQSPNAALDRIRKGVAYYVANLNITESTTTYVYFEVPIDDMGDTDFYKNMEAKHLIRWMI